MENGTMDLDLSALATFNGVLDAPTINIAVSNTSSQGNNELKSGSHFKNSDQGLVIVNASDYIGLDIPQRAWIFSPWLPTQGLALIHAFRGIGKTYLALQIGYLVACGGRFLDLWNAPQPRGVLFIDGEMPGCVLQERLIGMILGTGIEPQAPFKILTPDLQPCMMPDLGTRNGQDALTAHIRDIDLIIIDNISTLVRSVRENMADGWHLMQEWVLWLRSIGKSVLLIHHSGKTGKQRGTSRREDVLDTVISLRHPKDYSPDQGCRFEMHFEKARGLTGDAVKPLELQMSIGTGGVISWSAETIEASRHEKIEEMFRLDMSQTDIAKELGVNKSTVCRHLKLVKDRRKDRDEEK